MSLRRLAKQRRAETAPLPVEECHYGPNGNGSYFWWGGNGERLCPRCHEGQVRSYMATCEDCHVALHWRRWLTGQSLSARRHVHEGE
jgi:hypothetical protein